MLKPVLHIATFGAFLILVGIIGFFLWHTLFPAKEIGGHAEKAPTEQAGQQYADKKLEGGGAIPSHNNSVEEAIAEYTKWLAVFTAFLVLATVALFVSGERNVEVARESAGAAKEAANIARDALVAGQRPWLSIIGAKGGSPFTWDEQGGRITIEMAVKNVGKSPALDVAIESKAVIMSGETFSLSAMVKAFCDEVRDRQLKRTTSGEVLFPDDTIPQGHGLLFTKADIAANEKALGIKFFSPVMLVCIDYRSTITNQRHATGLAFFILQTPTEPGGFPSLLPTDKGTLPMNTLGVARAPFGSRAD